MEKRQRQKERKRDRQTDKQEEKKRDNVIELLIYKQSERKIAGERG